MLYLFTICICSDIGGLLFGKTFKGKQINNATELSLYLLEEALVATVTGEAFGNPNCIRISYAASQDQIIEAVQRIKNALSN